LYSELGHAAVATVSVVVPEPPVTVLGLNVAVDPGGVPLTLIVTFPVNPPVGVIWKMYVAVWPQLTFWKASEFDATDPLKSPADEFTTSVTIVLCTRPPLVPVTVMLYVPSGTELATDTASV
jgi:hypothetical protein